jgi:hypothetical protein
MPLKPASVYAQKMMSDHDVDPDSPQAKYYKDLAAIVLLVIADADVMGTGLVAPGGGGPVTGLAKIT